MIGIVLWENFMFLFFPRLNSLDVNNLCFTDPKARAILLWDSSSIEFVKDYVSMVCIGFDPPPDPLWWRNGKASVLPFKTTDLSDVILGEVTSSFREFLSTESSAIASVSDRVYREVKDVGFSGFAGIYGELLKAKTLLDSAYDEAKAKGVSMSLGLLFEVDSLKNGTLGVYSEVKSLGVHLVSETYEAVEGLGSELRLGVQEGFSDLDVSERTRGAFKAAGRLADSIWIGVLSVGGVGHLAIDNAIDQGAFV